MTAVKPSIAIIGAGPAGLEAAMFSVALGYPFKIYEKGKVGENLNKWPWVQMNAVPQELRSTLSLKFLGQERLLEKERIYIGEYIDYLRAISMHKDIIGSLHAYHEVLAVSRAGISKKDYANDPRRAKYPFRLLIRNPDGVEIIEQAHIVLDCGGVLGNPNCIGIGGIPAVGESENRKRFSFGILDFNSAASKFVGRHTVVIGDGQSAAENIIFLDALIQKDDRTRVTWIASHDKVLPYDGTAQEISPMKKKIYIQANQIVKNSHISLKCFFGAGTHCVSYNFEKENFTLVVYVHGEKFVFEADHIVNCTGFHPDFSILSELQIDLCPFSGVVKSLAFAVQNRFFKDKLDISCLRHPEPNFYIVGAKSFGRLPCFEIKFIQSQLKAIFKFLEDSFDEKHKK